MPAALPQRISLLLYGLLVTFLAVTTFWPEPPVEGVSVTLVLCVKLLPLLVFLPSLYKGSKRAWIWLSFVVLLYFTAASVKAWLHDGYWVSSVHTVLTVLLFLSALWTIRSRA